MEETDIIKETLQHLDGWKLDTEAEDLYDAEFNKIVTSEEVLHFYNVALDYANSYLQGKDISELSFFNTAVIMWTAGLLWNKYDIRVNNQLDETNTLGYGDKLIIQAKEMLKPYKNYSFYAY